MFRITESFERVKSRYSSVREWGAEGGCEGDSVVSDGFSRYRGGHVSACNKAAQRAVNLGGNTERFVPSESFRVFLS